MSQTPKTHAENKSETPGSESGGQPPAAQDAPVKEIGGPKGLEPTRYGDWERKGRCIDF